MTQFAFVFPGQGSQSVGMLAEMAANYPIVEETFAEASAALGYEVTAWANIPRWFALASSTLLMPFVWWKCAVNSCRKRFRKALAACLRSSGWMMPLLLKPVKNLPKGRLFRRLTLTRRDRWLSPVELAKITFSAPTVPVVNNVDVKCETDAAAIRDALVRQLYNPVQWTKSVEFIAAQGVEHLYEVGPGKVLTGLTKRIVDTLTASALNEPRGKP